MPKPTPTPWLASPACGEAPADRHQRQHAHVRPPARPRSTFGRGGGAGRGRVEKGATRMDQMKEENQAEVVSEAAGKAGSEPGVRARTLETPDAVKCLSRLIITPVMYWRFKASLATWGQGILSRLSASRV